MLTYAIFFLLFASCETILAATNTAVKGVRKKTGASYSTSSGSYSSYQSALINSSYERAVSPFELDGEPVIVHLTIPSIVLFSLVTNFGVGYVHGSGLCFRARFIAIAKTNLQEENKQLVSYVATVNITWTDPRLSFDPNETGYDYSILPSSMVWIPTVFCYNSIDVHRMDTEKDSNEVLVTPNGTVTLFQRARFDTICNCDISEFPFDTQYCSLDFDSGLSATDRQHLVPRIQDAFFKQGNAEWSLSLTAVQSKTDECSGYKYSFAVIGFTLTRNAEFYIYFLIVPTFIITTTCISGVMLPSTMSTGEKMSTGVAGLLGLTFLLSIIVNEVPRSPKLPLLGKWVIGEMSFCVISIAINAIGLNLNRLSEGKKFPQKRQKCIQIVRFFAFLVVFFSNILFTVIVLAVRHKRKPPAQYDTM